MMSYNKIQLLYYNIHIDYIPDDDILEDPEKESLVTTTPSTKGLKINESYLTSEPQVSELFTKQYRYALFIAVSLSAFHQLTGINGVIFHSNEIFTEGKDGLSADKAARLGTFFVGISGFVGALLTLIISNHLGRKTILLLGVGSMLVVLSFLGVTSIFNLNVPQIISVNFF
jgi:hypothetical protein